MSFVVMMPRLNHLRFNGDVYLNPRWLAEILSERASHLHGESLVGIIKELAGQLRELDQPDLCTQLKKLEDKVVEQKPLSDKQIKSIVNQILYEPPNKENK